MNKIRSIFPLVFLSSAVFFLMFISTAWKSSSKKEILHSVSEMIIPMQGETTDPSLSFDTQTGEILLSYLAEQDSMWSIRFIHSGDEGATWSNPVTVAGPLPEIFPHPEAAPRIVAGHHGIRAVFWVSRIPVEGRMWPASNLYCSRSTDDGATWQSPIMINDDTAFGYGSHSFHGATFDGDSTFVVAWIDQRVKSSVSHEMTEEHHEHGGTDEGSKLYISVSKDLGKTWSANMEQWKSICPCCRITLAPYGNGKILAAWRKHFSPEGTRDIVAGIIGMDEHPGESLVFPDQWEISGCPHSGPGIGADAKGNINVFWFTGKTSGAGVYFARSVGGLMFEKPIAIDTASVYGVAHTALGVFPDGSSVVAYDVQPGGTVSLALAFIDEGGTGISKMSVPDTDGADHPQITIGKGRTAFVAWRDQSAEPQRVRMVKVSEK